MAVDCLVIGGGVIGLTTAWRLAQQGLSVRVCDQTVPGREASWAGAGMLPPGYLGMTDPSLRKLVSRTCLLWPKMSAELFDLTGIENQFQRCGGLELALCPGDDLTHSIAAWEALGVQVELLDASEVRKREPCFSGAEAACLLPDLCQVRNPRHLAALLQACQLAGVEISPECPVTGWNTQSGRIEAALTPQGPIAAQTFLITAGAWSSTLLSQAGVSMEVTPVRGQIALLEPSAVQIRHVFERGKRYIVPRRDGRILIGSTEEQVGFHKENTDECIADLLLFAAEICPDLKNVSLEKCWSGLRPSTVRGRPYIGWVPGQDNLLVAAGHFRSGLHLSPVTAEILVSLVRGDCPSPDWDVFKA